MNTEQMKAWESSRLKKRLDVVFNVALTWCGAAVLAIVLGVDLGAWL